MQYHWAHNVHKQTDFIPHYRYQCYLHGDDFQDNCQFVEHSKHLWDCHHLHLHHCHPEVTLLDRMWKSKCYLVITEISFNSKVKLFSLSLFFSFLSCFLLTDCKVFCCVFFLSVNHRTQGKNCQSTAQSTRSQTRKCLAARSPVSGNCKFEF